ncbi:GNAT family N-acetyltransferase [Marinospirillum perlucidum]|uniref:GNAT family N-acetyltransferase n=1 Tax=Marinospirillum perlucidum TaxID=1982602 RepID=UPI000DF2CEAC|nr:GNAT family N-acetyltransferase [Marinospirillum perlucidum]
MSLRLARQKDLPEIVRIYNASIPAGKATADTLPVTVEQRLDWFASHQSPERPLWVWEDEQRLGGWVSLGDFYGRPAYRNTCEVSIYLDPACQGQGLGKKLLQHALEAAREVGITRLVGYIFAHNEASLRLFEAEGFESWGYLPEVAEINGRVISLCILGKKLDQG